MACYGNLPLTVALYAPLALGVSIGRRHAALAGGVASTGQPPTARTLSAASLAPPLLALAAAECARLGSAYILALLCGINGLALVLSSALCHLARAPTAALWVQVLGALLPILHIHSVSSRLWLRTPPPPPNLKPHLDPHLDPNPSPSPSPKPKP